MSRKIETCFSIHLFIDRLHGFGHTAPKQKHDRKPEKVAVSLIEPDIYMDFREPEHIAMLRESLRKFVEREMPRDLAAKWDKDNHFPRDVFAKLAGLGVMGLIAPEEYGGAGRDIVACMVTIEELAKRSSNITVPYIMAACYAGMNIFECGTEEQKKDLLPKVAAGELIFAYGLTEPEAGADLAAVRTTAIRDGDELVINGAKRFCSGADIADYIYTLAITDKSAPRYKNLSLIMVPARSQGITITRIESMGLKGAETTDVIFEDVRVPIGNIMGGEAALNDGWRQLVGPGLDVEKLEVAAMALGLAQAAIDDAWDYAESREQFGKKISGFQAIRHSLAESRTRQHAARLVLNQAAWLADNHLPCRVETSMAKLFVCEAAKQIVLDCQTIMGAYGYTKGFDMERYVREVLVMPIIGGSSAVQRNNIANGLKLAT